MFVINRAVGIILINLHACHTIVCGRPVAGVKQQHLEQSVGNIGIQHPVMGQQTVLGKKTVGVRSQDHGTITLRQIVRERAFLGK